MDIFIRDIRYSIRMLLKKPGFTLIAFFMLAVGIGANTAIFTVVNAVLLRPLPYPASERLMEVGRAFPGNPFGSNVSEPDRKSTRLNSSHSQISYAVFCLK